MSVVTEEGKTHSVRGIENSEGAHALISLQVAAAKASNDQARLREREVDRWTNATIPIVVKSGQSLKAKRA